MAFVYVEHTFRSTIRGVIFVFYSAKILNLFTQYVLIGLPSLGLMDGVKQNLQIYLFNLITICFARRFLLSHGLSISFCWLTPVIFLKVVANFHQF